MAYIEVGISSELSTWELKFACRSCAINPQDLSFWLRFLKPSKFMGRISLTRVTAHDSSSPTHWYVTRLVCVSRGETALQVFNEVLHASKLRHLFLVMTMTDTRAVFVLKGCSAKPEEFRGFFDAEVDYDRRNTLVQEEFKLGVSKCREDVGFAYLKSLAEKHQLLGGHWSMYFSWQDDDLQGRLDLAWCHLVGSYFAGPLANRDVVSICVSPSLDGYAVKVGNEVFTDQKQVFSIEKQIRMSGITEQLKYKPDIYSICDVFHGNLLELRPTIYMSRYMSKHSCSYIDSDYTSNYVPDIPMQGRVWYNVL